MTKTYELVNEGSIMADVDEKHHTVCPSCGARMSESEENNG